MRLIDDIYINNLTDCDNSCCLSCSGARVGPLSQHARSVSSTVANPGTQNRQTVTVFGANGAVGMMTCSYLGTLNYRMVVPFRDDGYNIRDVKLTGSVGQVAPIHYSMFDEDSIRKTVERSDIVINLIGSQVPTRHYSVHDANLKTALRLAKISKECGVDRFVQVSSAGAHPSAPSEFQRVKYESEQAVKAYFPKASIIRPTFTFDLNNQYLHYLAQNSKQFFNYVLCGDALVQPVFARDVGQAIAQIVSNPQIDGQTWTLGGDKVLSRYDLYYLMHSMINIRPIEITNISSADVLQAKALMEKFGVPKIISKRIPANADYLAADVTVANSPVTKGFAELGITPTPLEQLLIRMTRPYMSEYSNALHTKLSKWKYTNDV